MALSGLARAKIYRRGMQGFFLWQRRFACCVGVALVSDLSDLSDLSDKMGAPVFALTGYAVASHVIPRGFACRSVVWLGRRFTAGVIQRADLPQGYALLA